MSIFTGSRLASPLVAMLAVMLIAGCVPRMYQRSTVTLDTAVSDDNLSVRYGDLDGCLLRQQIPVEYTIRRPRYTLIARPVSALDAQPRIELRTSESGVVLRFDGIDPPQAPLYAEHGSRYVVDVESLPAAVLAMSVYRGEERLGTEHFRISPQRCRIFSPTG